MRIRVGPSQNIKVLEDVENALITYAKEHNRNEALKRAFDADKNAVRLARLRHEAGTLDLLEVLTVERNVLLSESDLVTSNHALRQRYVTLRISFGV